MHLIRFRRVLAPNAKLQALVVPRGPAQTQEAREVADSESEAERVQSQAGGISWAMLLKRVFDTDTLRYPNCGNGELKIVAAIRERPVIEAILTHLGLQPQPPPKTPAREPAPHHGG